MVNLPHSPTRAVLLRTMVAGAAIALFATATVAEAPASVDLKAATRSVLSPTIAATHLAERLEALGLDVHRGVGGTGLLGVLRGQGPGQGPTILYRADLDGLPVKEKTGVEWASENDGVMHACGHDVHMSVALGALSVLANAADRWAGTILFVGQPAEEVGKGARAIMADRTFKKVLKQVGKPRVALAIHDATDIAAGEVSLLPGFAHANVDSVDIVVHGTGGHGAQPQNAVDPVLIASEMVMSLQSIVSRRIKGSEPAVITVGSFHAGSKHNIIPSRAELKLTVRSYSDETRATLLGEIKRVATHIAAAHNAPRPPEVTVLDEYTPAAFNDPAWTEKLQQRLVEELGASRVTTHLPTLGGEDFGQYSRMLKIPGVMFKVGASDPRRIKAGKPVPGLHSDRFIPVVEPTLSTGVHAVSAALLLALQSP
jgi:amidohydrolase